MPPRAKRVYKKRKTASRKATPRRKYARASIEGFAPGMPKVRTARLRYVQTQTMTTADAGALADVAYYANGPFLPVTGGHQPMGFDQWSALYDRYIVKGSRISIRAHHPRAFTGGVDVASTSPVMVGCYLSDVYSHGYTTFSSFIEAKKGTWKMLPLTTEATGKAYMYGSTFSTKKFFNISDVKDHLTDLGATIGANPASPFQAIYNLWVQSYGTLAAGTTAKVDLVVTIDYIIEFSQPKDLTPS